VSRKKRRRTDEGDLRRLKRAQQRRRAVHRLTSKSPLTKSSSENIARSPAKKRRRPLSDPQSEKALRLMRAGNSQRLAAKSAGVPLKRFRQFTRENKLARFRKGKWHFTDKRRRQIVAITTRGEKELVVRGFEPASWAMSHRNAVREFFETADISLLAPFDGVSITDERGQKFFLETGPNVLLRHSSAGGEPYEQIYKLQS
jgi:hypothetical protein